MLPGIMKGYFSGWQFNKWVWLWGTAYILPAISLKNGLLLKLGQDKYYFLYPNIFQFCCVFSFKKWNRVFLLTPVATILRCFYLCFIILVGCFDLCYCLFPYLIIFLCYVLLYFCQDYCSHIWVSFSCASLPRFHHS